MLTFFLRCPLSIFDVFVITIIIIMTLAPLPIKSLVALKRIETNSGPRNSWREPGVSACQIRVKVSFFYHATCLQFGNCVSQKIQVVSFFWSKFVQRCWREGGRGDGHLAFPLAKGASPDVFYFQNWKTSPLPKVPLHILIMMPLWFLLSLKTTLI